MTAAKNTKTASEFVENADVTQVPEGWEWDTVSEAVPIGVVFENPGEKFVGQYQERAHVDREPAANGEDRSFDLLIFKGQDGQRYSMSPTFLLNEAMEKVQPGDWCLLQYVKDVKTSREQSPMKDITVSVRK